MKNDDTQHAEEFKPSIRQRYSFIVLDIVFGAFLIIFAITLYGCIFG